MGWEGGEKMEGGVGGREGEGGECEVEGEEEMHGVGWSLGMQSPGGYEAGTEIGG